MKNNKLTSYPTFILLVTLFIFVTLTPLLGLFCFYYIGGEDGKLILYVELMFFAFQIPASIILIKRINVRNNYYIKGNEITQNNEVILDRREINSIKKVGLFKVEIKYTRNYEEKTIYIVATNKKIKNIKETLCIYD